MASNDDPVGRVNEQTFLKYFARHIVATCGSYVHLDANRQR
jgi:hypothetical protein